MFRVETEHAFAHGEILVPATELHPCALERIVALDYGCVEWNRQRRVQEVQEVRGSGPEPLDSPSRQPPNGVEERLLVGAARAHVEELAERELILAILVDIRYPQLRLPQERVIRAPEDLPLLGDGANDRLERRAPVGVPEGVALDVGDHGCDPAANRAEVLETLLPQEPGPIGAAGILAPAFKQMSCALSAHRSGDCTRRTGQARARRELLGRANAIPRPRRRRSPCRTGTCRAGSGLHSRPSEARSRRRSPRVEPRTARGSSRVGRQTARSGSFMVSSSSPESLHRRSLPQKLHHFQASAERRKPAPDARFLHHVALSGPTWIREDPDKVTPLPQRL